MATYSKFINWIIFALLCFIWGSSFILMKEGLKGLDAFQVASLRILSAGIVLLPHAIKKFSSFDRRAKKSMLITGLLGSFFPAYLFCIAETRIDSALAGLLNSLTPILTMVTGVYIYGARFTNKKWIGVITGLVGMVTLLVPELDNGLEHLAFSGLVLLATMSYALNTNYVGNHLRHISPLDIAAIAFAMLILPSLVILIVTGFFNSSFSDEQVLKSLGASLILGIFGTAFASVLFYRLLKNAGTLMASMVTYGIPFIALFWGLIAGESIHIFQVLGLGIILGGVAMTRGK